MDPLVVSCNNLKADFVYDCLEEAPSHEQNDLRVALFDHRENGGNNGVVDAATHYIESMGKRCFYVVIALKPCHSDVRKDQEALSIKRRLLRRFIHRCCLDVSSPSMVVLWRFKVEDGSGKVEKMLLDDLDAETLDLEMGRQMSEPLDVCVRMLNIAAGALELTPAEKCFGRIVQSEVRTLFLICIPGRELKETISLRQIVAELLPNCEMGLITFSAGSGCKGAAHITYGPMSMSTNVMAAVPRHAGCSRIAGQVRLGQPMPGHAAWKTSHGPNVVVCPHTSHAKTKRRPVKITVSSNQPGMMSVAEECINNDCEKIRHETEKKATLDRIDPLREEVCKQNAVAREMKAILKKGNGIVPTLVQSALNTEPRQQQQQKYQQQTPDDVKKKRKKKLPKRKAASRERAEEKQKYIKQCQAIAWLNEKEETVLKQDLNSLVDPLIMKLTAMEEKPLQRKKYTSNDAHDLACKIQSGAQRGEQMRREVASFAEVALEKNAAEVFADIIVQRILNPKAAKTTAGCHAPPKKVRQKFAKAFVAKDWTDELLKKITENTVLAAIGDTWIRQLEEGLSCFLQHVNV